MNLWMDSALENKGMSDQLNAWGHLFKDINENLNKFSANESTWRYTGALIQLMLQ